MCYWLSPFAMQKPMRFYGCLRGFGNDEKEGSVSEYTYCFYCNIIINGIMIECSQKAKLLGLIEACSQWGIYVYIYTRYEVYTRYVFSPLHICNTSIVVCIYVS